MAEQLSAEAQAMVDEGMRLAVEFGLACEHVNRAPLERFGELMDESVKCEQALRAHLERMAAPHPVAREPLRKERIRELGKGAFGIDINFDGALMLFARAIEREIAQGEQP